MLTKQSSNVIYLDAIVAKSTPREKNLKWTFVVFNLPLSLSLSLSHIERRINNPTSE